MDRLKSPSVFVLGFDAGGGVDLSNLAMLTTDTMSRQTPSTNNAAATSVDIRLVATGGAAGAVGVPGASRFGGEGGGLGCFTSLSVHSVLYPLFSSAAVSVEYSTKPSVSPSVVKLSLP